MLEARLTSVFDAVSVNDPSLLDLPDAMVIEYIKTRDIDKLDLSKCTTQPTIFQCSPLLAKYEYLADAVADQNSAAAWSIFQKHVRSAKNQIDDNGKSLLEWSDGPTPELLPECRDRITRDVVQEIAGVIFSKANQPTMGFTVPAGFLEQRQRSRVLHAARAAARIVKKENPPA